MLAGPGQPRDTEAQSRGQRGNKNDEFQWEEDAANEKTQAPGAIGVQAVTGAGVESRGRGLLASVVR